MFTTSGGGTGNRCDIQQLSLDAEAMLAKLSTSMTDTA